MWIWGEHKDLEHITDWVGLQPVSPGRQSWQPVNTTALLEVWLRLESGWTWGDRGWGHGLRSLGTRAQRPQPNSLRNLTIVFIIHAFSNLQMLKKEKNREIVYDLWSFFFFNLEVEWAKTMELTLEECWKSHLLLYPSSSGCLEVKEEIYHGVILTSVEFTESSDKFRGYLACMACHPVLRTKKKEPQISHHFSEPWSPQL